ncbi:hypothetical protein, partial [Rhodoplanes sp. SY1]|uniref:hypothetical protein n=1 Tax=Rhodoplanes sp. SY1 TaxID=3166646 RepID=UPI0038B50302
WVCRAYADVTSHACGEVQAHGFWATVDSLADGPASLDTLKRHAETGRPFGEGRNRHVVVEAAESPPGEQHLALCSVRVIAGTVGPPQDCATVAILRPDVTLLRSDVKRWESESLMCRVSATFRLDGVTIDFGFVVDTGHGPEAFATPLGKLLREEFGFATEMQVERSEDGKVTAVSFVAATAPRDSLILAGGWRESLNFDLRILRQGRGVGVSGTTRPMVCRQASGRLVDYSAPDDVQRSTYATVINDKIVRAITTACAEVTRVDDKNLVCK